MPSYVSNFKKFVKSEDSKESIVKSEAQLSEQDESSILTDPDLIRIEGQIRDLEKQLENVKQQKETKLKDLRSRIQAAKAAAPAPAQTPAQPAA
jgi:uncharacterized coiled-coil DUF342 family protein